MDDAQKAVMDKMSAPCACGSGKKYAMCCGTAEAATTPCPCGSGKMCSECCMKAPEAHAAM